MRSKPLRGRHAAHLTDEERFWDQVQKTDGCWLWKAAKPGKYGRFQQRLGSKKLIAAHRQSYEFANGPIPNGLMMCHKCDNPPCVRPDHLFPGTGVDNIADARAKDRLKKMGMKSLCKNGHALTPENILYGKRGNGALFRVCRRCSIATKERYRTRIKEDSHP